MKKTIGILLLVINACMLCSTLKENEQNPFIEDVKTNQSLYTKGGDLGTLEQSKEELIHYAQSDHIAMLIYGVILVDGSYVQSLTEEDMKSLSMTEIEKEFSNKYVKTLNELMKRGESGK